MEIRFHSQQTSLRKFRIRRNNRSRKRYGKLSEETAFFLSTREEMQLTAETERNQSNRNEFAEFMYISIAEM
jgi:hypothetical protein